VILQAEGFLSGTISVGEVVRAASSSAKGSLFADYGLRARASVGLGLLSLLVVLGKNPLRRRFLPN
jgi:hypothetical protein